MSTNPKRHFYVRVAEHLTETEFIPFSSLRPKKPGAFQSSVTYGPYTYVGVKRVVNWAFANVKGERIKSARTWNEYASDMYGTRVVSVFPYLPHGDKPIRNFPSKGKAAI